MKIIKPALIVLCLIFPVIGLATIYQWKDSQGTVHYSDQPNPQGREVHIGEPQGYSSPVTQDVEDSEKAATDEKDNSTGEGSPKAAASSSYSSLEIIQPHNEETLRNNNGLVDVMLNLEPPLAAGHRLVVYLDGKEAQSTDDGVRLTVSEVFRGQHELVARVLDEKGDVLISSNPVVIYMQRTTQHKQ